MKKLTLGLGILALSLAVFAVEVSKDVDVIVHATIADTIEEIVLFDGETEIGEGIGMYHATSNRGERVPPVSKTVVARLRGSSGGGAMRLNSRIDEITATFKNPTVALHKTGEEGLKMPNKFDSELTVDVHGDTRNNEKSLVITSTPAVNSTQALTGTYSGAGTMVITVNKL